MVSEEETIAAIATPIGQAGVGIVRISGPLSAKIAKKIFRHEKDFEEFESHSLYLGHLLDPTTETMIDEVLLSYMKAPHSYTREDVIEINSHSGHLLLSKILQIIIDQGARLAKPGEFTMRAFRNGRIDLTQAEAVVDLINSQSDKGLELASQQLKGKFRKKIEVLRNKALDLLSHLEIAIDFPEEDAMIMSEEGVRKQIEEGLLEPIHALIKAHKRKRIWVDGVSTVIVGRVNAGKSSLLNCLLNEQRAIVTPVPGTTRDVIESTITVEGIPLKLMDTAGFREVRNQVESIGIRLTAKKIEEADLVLVVIDQSRPLNSDDLKTISYCENKKAIIVINKTDLPSKIDFENYHSALHGFPIVKISALTGNGILDLSTAIKDCILEGGIDTSVSQVVPNIRHNNALTMAAEYFKEAFDSITHNAPYEIIAFDLKSGLDALGEVIGDTTNEDILDNIFSQFCLGK